MQAIILAAGMGKRLKELTKDNTKCMVKVNGVTLIDRMLHQIEKFDVSKITIVVGYEGQKLIDYINTLGICTPIEFISNPIYDKTNNIYSLSLAKDVLCAEDTLLFESDLIFEDAVLETLINDPRPSLALVDKYESWMDGTCVKIRANDSIESFISAKSFYYDDADNYYKTVNIYKFSKDFSSKYYVPFLEAYLSALGQNEYYEQVLRVIAMLDEPVIRVKRLSGQKWYEIDDIQDLDIAESLFCKEPAKQVNLMQERFGGYWRYPKLLDFCYLVNPYYPNIKMKDEIKANFDKLLTEYPSGMRINSLLAAKNFGIRTENIVVGNGAAELIKSLMNHISGITGFIRPSFEEYANRYPKESSICFIPNNIDFSYTADDIIEFFSDKEIKNLVVINPDNPSGNYLPKADVMKLANWTNKKGITLIIDESFIDFATEECTFISQDFLNAHENVFVIKSISKSYGIPGLCLGVMASGNTAAIDFIKKDVAIWNINSFAEFYMQIHEKYKKDYVNALTLFKAERDRFTQKLSEIKDLRVIPSQANYLMVELMGNTSAAELLQTLMIKYNILIKDLTAKTGGGNYLRIAVRDTADNDRLLSALSKELGLK